MLLRHPFLNALGVISIAVAAILASVNLFSSHTRSEQVVVPILHTESAVAETASPLETVATEPGSPLANVNFFTSIKERMVHNGTDFVEANLTDMRLRVWSGGQVALEVPILTKGKKGSWWETPAGLYKAGIKTKNHFSSFGKVYTKWNIPFQGNFFIHGWPTYPSGEAVSTQYSGGCIRLNDDDAKSVYDLADSGEPIVVLENPAESSVQTTFLQQTQEFGAKYFLATDLENNFMLSRGDKKTFSLGALAGPMASLIATDYLNIERAIPAEYLAQYRAAEEAANPRVYDALFPMLINSDPSGAIASVASVLGSSHFQSLMSRKAVALGMEHTHFADSLGASEENVSTSEDLFYLAKYLNTYRKFILDISAGRQNNRIYGASRFSDMKNENIFMTDPTFIGGKADLSVPGHQSMFALFKMTLDDGSTRPVAFVAIDSPDVATDIINMKADITKNYQAQSGQTTNLGAAVSSFLDGSKTEFPY